ncbi:MAG: hypothetical protein QM758_29990 [Armatimonas sp.]
MRLLASASLLGLCLAFTGGCQIHPAQAQTQTPLRGAASAPEARRMGLPKKVGDWTLVRFVPGKEAHFLYTQKRRSFSLFVVDQGRDDTLQGRKGWTAARLPGGTVAYLHTDPRDPSRSAIAWKRGQQRRILIGRMQSAELQSLAAKL